MTNLQIHTLPGKPPTGHKGIGGISKSSSKGPGKPATVKSGTGKKGGSKGGGGKK